MWILEEGQILPYLRSHYPVFDQSGPVDIQCIGALEGEEKPREPDEGGLINYIFRVSNGKQSVIVKQGRSASRKNDKIVLPIWRNRQEYETLRLRHAIVPQYTPETYYVDWENAIFLMEDVSDLARESCYPDWRSRWGNLLRRAPFTARSFIWKQTCFEDFLHASATAICGPSWKTGCSCGMHPTSPIMETRCSNSLLTGMRASGFAATSCATNL